MCHVAGRVSKYHRQELEYLGLYATLCEETADYPVLMEAATFFRNRGNLSLYSVYLQGAESVFKKVLNDINPKELNLILI